MEYNFASQIEFGAPEFTQQLENNISEFLKWAVLETGGFTIVDTNTLGYPSGSTPPSQLSQVQQVGVTSGTIWEGRRSDWVWETGVVYATKPVRASGLTINGTGVPTGWIVDYPLGRVTFAGPVASSARVKIPHTYRNVQVRRADEPWFIRFDPYSLRGDSTPEGNILSTNRIQCPCLVVEPLGNASLQAYELGSDAKYVKLDFILHVLSETPWERKWLHDKLILQHEHFVPTFDLVTAPFPLSNGAPISGALTYPELCTQYPWRTVRVAGVKSGEFDKVGGLFWCVVRWTVEVACP